MPGSRNHGESRAGDGVSHFRMGRDRRPCVFLAAYDQRWASDLREYVAKIGTLDQRLDLFFVLLRRGAADHLDQRFLESGVVLARFAEHRVESMLEDIDASADQETKIWAIIDKTRSELRPVGREFRDTREQVVALLSAPTIDREAVEKLRSERIAAIDEASKKAVSAIVEAAEVLTPEQRTKLVAEMKERHEDRKDRRGHMKGRHGDRMGGNDDRP